MPINFMILFRLPDVSSVSKENVGVDLGIGVGEEVVVVGIGVGVDEVVGVGAEVTPKYACVTFSLNKS